MISYNTTINSKYLKAKQHVPVSTKHTRCKTTNQQHANDTHTKRITHNPTNTHNEIYYYKYNNRTMMYKT